MRLISSLERRGEEEESLGTFLEEKKAHLLEGLFIE
jgi:hypothetical protein